MQRQRQKKTKASATAESRKPARFTLLLAEIRSRLGDDWTFYEECIGGVLDAAAKQEDTTAWFEQMQQIVEGVDKVRFSHEGVLFLLRDMGIDVPEQRSRGEGEGATLGMYLSPPVSPPIDSSPMGSSSVNNMAPESVHPPSNMKPLLPLRPLGSNTPAVAAWPPPRVPTPFTRPAQQQDQQLEEQQHQQQVKKPKQPIILHNNVLPFDFSASVLPGLTFPENFRDYHCPRDEIVLTGNYVPPSPNPLRKTSNDPVFFSSPTLKANVTELFGHTAQRKDHTRRSSNSIWQPPPGLPYDPEDDDLVIWKKRLEGGTDDEHNEVKAGFNTWPPWNPRLDLEM